MSSLHINLADEAATWHWGLRLGQHCPLPLMIGLSGELGAGKTALSQAIGAGFGISDPMPSPTFTLINEYTGPRGHLYHLDLYRLNHLDELLEMGLDDVLAKPDVLLLVEWVDRFDWPMGPPRLDLHLFHHPPGRRLEMQLPDTLPQAYQQLATRLFP